MWYGSGMRVSPQKHTLAVLRILLGKTQKEMAGILACSVPTIQAVELGKLKLSEKLAGLTSLKTGISLAWLLKNDTTQPPVDVDGVDFTKAKFEEVQALGGFKNDAYGGTIAVRWAYQVNIGRLEALLFRALTDDKMALCAYKLGQVFDELEVELGVTIQDHKIVGSWMASAKRFSGYTQIGTQEIVMIKEIPVESKFYKVIQTLQEKKHPKRKLVKSTLNLFANGQVRPETSEQSSGSPSDSIKKYR
jgi:transcriptional regulator with XRE-family HTH domain